MNRVAIILLVFALVCSQCMNEPTLAVRAAVPVEKPAAYEAKVAGSAPVGDTTKVPPPQGSNATSQETSTENKMEMGTEKINKSEEEWKDQLSADEYNVLREHGTERAFSGEFWDHHEHGMYLCAACKLPLFDSDTKFDSGTGWPSYYQPLSSENVEESRDSQYGMVRTEVHCARCGGHLGHVFDDGPKPTGLRYCINSISLDFEKK